MSINETTMDRYHRWIDREDRYKIATELKTPLDAVQLCQAFELLGPNEQAYSTQGLINLLEIIESDKIDPTKRQTLPAIKE